MDNIAHCKSWEDSSLKAIVQDISQVFASNEIAIEAKLKTGMLPYTVQYKETAWQFLNRMTASQGEWLFYNGKKIVMGSIEASSTDLVFGNNPHHFSVAMQLRPTSFSKVTYDYENNTTYNIAPNNVSAQAGLNSIAQFAYDKSAEFYASSPKSYTAQFVNNKTQLQQQVQTQAAAQSANHINFNGNSSHFGVQLGNIVNINHNYGSYQIIEVSHSCDGQGNYQNNFIAIPASIQVPPVTGYAMPFSETQTAVVVENHDSAGLGRIKVRMHWMNQNEQTPWIRMVHPHAGGNKGIFFIPEKGEEVKIAFENGDPIKPYIIGAVYNGGANSHYSNTNNDLKVIETRSGTLMQFNDDEGSIFIKDPSGNTWHMDGKGNISVNAPNNISMYAGNNINITAGATITTSAGANMIETVGINKTSTVLATSSSFIGGNSLITVEGMLQEVYNKDVISHTEKDRITISRQKTTFTSEQEIETHSKAEINLNSAEKTKLF
jgi:type VI secretion system secreted protein VgrG